MKKIKTRGRVLNKFHRGDLVKLKRHYRSQTVPGIILEIEPEFNTSKIFLGNTLIVYFANKIRALPEIFFEKIR